MRLNEGEDEKSGFKKGIPRPTQLSQAQTKLSGTKCKHFRSLFAFLYHFVCAQKENCAGKRGFGFGKWVVFALPAGIRLRSASHIYLSRAFPCFFTPELLCFYSNSLHFYDGK